jgi:putative two-component system response regulator
MNNPTIPLTRNQILVLEADAGLREEIVRTLQIEGHMVIQTGDSEVALELMKRITPELVIADLDTQANTGDDFYLAVRQNPAWTAIPFIIITSNHAPEDAQSWQNKGVEDFLTMPLDHDHLARTVNARLLRQAELKVALMDQAYLETIDVLANTIESRDPYTHGHVERVTAYAKCLAEELNWPEENLRSLEFGARLHDIGKIIVPDNILNKPGPLTIEEWVLMRQHTSAGAKILKGIRHLQVAVPFVLYHHERWDGSGYPKGLQGRNIPLEGRVLALADVYDALTTSRPYHPARPHHEVLRYLRIRAGTHFDPDLVEIFIQALERRGYGQKLQ